jgi:ferric-dicitrate binding protein FerR (iron transport regulator)
MNAADLSQAERAEFMQWLLKRNDPNSKVSESPSKLGRVKKKERLKQFKECFDWLKVRITESDLSESEQREFDSWLASRARESNFWMMTMNRARILFFSLALL